MERGTRFLWRAAGEPEPAGSTGEPIPPRDMGGQHCASCGEPATNPITDAISDNFTTVFNASRGWPFGGNGICRACLWACRSVALRCALFFARENGIWFIGSRPIKGLPQTRPDVLSALLSPPEPPFVAGYPLTGVEHGGDDALARCALKPYDIPEDAKALAPAMAKAVELAVKQRPANVAPEEAKKAAFLALVNLDLPWPCDVDLDELRQRFGHYRYEPWWRWAAWPMLKIQSKHTALYAKVSYSRERYHLQVDDAGDVVVDVAVWSEMRTRCDELLAEMRSAGVGATAARDALLTLQAPFGAPLPLLARWSRAVAPMRPHAASTWWRLFISLLHMPDLPAKG